VNYTLCGDQLRGTVMERIYEWQPLVSFLAEVMGRPQLYLMEDTLARLNILAYRPGEALNWHFDRSQYTVTLLLRAAQSGGEFHYRSELRTADDPNYEGVAKLMRGEDPLMAVERLQAGTLSVFAGRNTAHRVTPVGGRHSRVVAVLSYYETPGFRFSERELIGFYGRAG
jgi:2OG-Fe(II) oxygenase superfamily